MFVIHKCRRDLEANTLDETLDDLERNDELTIAAIFIGDVERVGDGEFGRGTVAPFPTLILLLDLP